MAYTVIDVSKWNGGIDFKKVKASGVAGVIIRATYGTGVDRRFVQYADAATAAGLPFGVYCFSIAKTAQAAKQEAQAVLEAVKPYSLSYSIYFDTELDSTEKNAVEAARAFCEVIERAGYWAGIYTGEYRWTSYLYPLANRYTKWIAKYGTDNGKPQREPKVDNVDMWQYTSKGRVNGVSGDVDMNLCYKDFPAIIRGKQTDGAIKKTTAEIVDEVLAGKWGNGDKRKAALTAAGYNYKEIQEAVNAKLADDKITAVALDVIKGKYGNGAARGEALKKAGYDPRAVQKKVNELLAG